MPLFPNHNDPLSQNNVPLISFYQAAVVGVFVYLVFYRHIVEVIFNRKPGFLQFNPMLQLFKITKPLELIWRFVTAPLRDLPDVVIIGEVRCGTTSLADHLKALPGAAGPFCAFIHPLDGKESFYFSGHYFGVV